MTRILIATVVFVVPLYSQQFYDFDREAERAFAAALKKFSTGEYAAAAVDFEHIIALPPHHRTTAGYVMLGKSYYMAKQFRQCTKILKQFIDTYPESYYLDDAYYTLGLNYEAQRRYDDALVQFLAAVETTTDSRVRKRAYYYCDKIIDEKLSVATLAEFAQDIQTPEAQDFLRIKLAEKHLVAGNILAAEKALEAIPLRNPPSAHYARAEDLLQKIRSGVSIRVGVLLPLMKRSPQKYLKTYGEELLQGIQFALDESASQSNSLIDVVLDIRDTERDPAISAQHTKELTEDRSVVAILGPMLNQEAVASAGFATTQGVPLMTPANADGIAAIGPHIFQLHPDMTTSGRAAARYAVTELGFTTLAVLAPSEGGSKTAAVAFVHEALSAGARVVATEWYASNTTDLREQFTKIRRAALLETEPLISFGGPLSHTDLMKMVEMGVSPQRIDSLLSRGAAVSVIQMFGPRGKRIADSLQLTTFIPEGVVESIDTPATGIQAIYMPIDDPQKIAILSAQLAYFNIKAQILGSSEWYNGVELDANKRYTAGAIFFSDFYVDAKDSTFMNFSRRWFEKVKRKASTNTVVGYDAMHLLSTLIYSGITSREGITQALNNVDRMPLLHGYVTLTTNRVNKELHVLKFKGNEIVKIGNVSVP